MRLIHLELEHEPACTLHLHPRLTVVEADGPARARVVGSLDGLLRGRASGLRGALVGEGAMADFIVESTSGTVLPGAPLVLRAADLEYAAGGGDGPSPVEHAEARHQRTVEDLERAEQAHAAMQREIDALQERRARAVHALDGAAAAGAEPEHCRVQLRDYLDDLQRAALAPSLDGATRVRLLERGTVLAADAVRLSVCRPPTVRALLDALGALNRAPSFPPAPRAGDPPSLLDAAREVRADLDRAGSSTTVDGDAARAELLHSDAELREATTRLDALQRAVSAARSRALAVFAELETVRRTSGGAVVTGFVPALRARLTGRAPASWVGVPPVILDDTLRVCPPDDVAGARAVVVDASERAQLIYVTDDPDAIEWARSLPPDIAGVAVATPVRAND
jgi:hypothetical protein